MRIVWTWRFYFAARRGPRLSRLDALRFAWKESR